MSLSQEIRTRLQSGPSFQCECCGLTFDRDRLNCPACGYEVRDAR